MMIALIRAARKAQADSIRSIQRARVSRELALDAAERQLNLTATHELARMKKMDAYIAMRGSHNITELSDVPIDRMKLVAKKCGQCRTSGCRKPSGSCCAGRLPSMAQLAGMSTEAFEDFYFDVCTLDYRKASAGDEGAQGADGEDRSGANQRPGHRSAFQHQGHCRDHLRRRSQHSRWRSFQLPGEGFASRDTSPSTRRLFIRAQLSTTSGSIFGTEKSSKQRATTPQKLNKILDSDAGARYIGEFSLGFNPYVLHPMRDILFDEKIAGSFHFTPGQAYEEADNGNRSQVHWDMVNIQRKDYGGGEIYFDGKLIRRDGEFLAKPLRSLNWKNFR